MLKKVPRWARRSRFGVWMGLDLSNRVVQSFISSMAMKRTFGFEELTTDGCDAGAGEGRRINAEKRSIGAASISFTVNLLSKCRFPNRICRLL